MKSQEKRLGFACMCVLSLIALPGLASGLANYVSCSPNNGGMQRSDTQTSNISKSQEIGAHESMAESLFNRLAGKHDQSCLPESFCEEIFDPSQWGSHQCYATEGFVGLFWDKPQSSSAVEVWQALERSGWKRIGLTDQSSSCIKDTGLYRWLNVGVFCSNGGMSINLNYRKEA